MPFPPFPLALGTVVREGVMGQRHGRPSFPPPPPPSPASILGGYERGEGAGDVRVPAFLLSPASMLGGYERGEGVLETCPCLLSPSGDVGSASLVGTWLRVLLVLSPDGRS